MMSRVSVCVAAALAVVALVLGTTANVEACPFCGGPTLTLSERFLKANSAVLVQWVDGQPSTQQQAGSTTYEIVQMVRDENSVESLAVKAKEAKAPEAAANSTKRTTVKRKPLVKGQRITIKESYRGKSGDLSLLMGSVSLKPSGESFEWGPPLEVTETVFNYIMQAPSLESSPTKRLEYFLKFLEYPDQTIANDAYAEFANASYKDIVVLAPLMPRENLRKWLASHKVPQNRLGLYGLMLGLCGNRADAVVMEKKIKEISTEPDEPRLGIDGIIGGYLLLTGEKGLALIEKSKFLDTRVPFSETYAALQAVRFLWSYGDNKIPAERLRASMRLLLDRPELIDIAIVDLARWKDWSIQKRLIEGYGTGEYSDSAAKRAIIGYMIASTKDSAARNGKNAPSHVVEGTRWLEQIRKQDPKTVAEAARHFPVQ